MLRRQFLKTIQKFRMIEKGETVFVAVSGGCDSTCLLYLLNEIRAEWKLKIGILHVNHQLRGKDSVRDEQFVRAMGRKFKIPVFVERVNVKRKMKEGNVSLEEAARMLRYDFFERTAKAKRVDKIATAHTQDDQAETVLMRIISGTGLQGLQAIRPKRKLNGCFLVRPMIEISRKDIEQFATEKKIKFRTDESNRSTEFPRNRIRLKLLPEIERSFNPQVKKALARLPYLLDVDLAFLEESAELFYRKFATAKHKHQILFPKRPFLQLRPSMQYRLLGRALRTLEAGELDFEHWNDFLKRVATEKRFKLQFPKGTVVSVSSNEIQLQRGKLEPGEFSYLLREGEELYIPEIKKTFACEILDKKPRLIKKLKKNYDLFDADKLTFPLVVRSRKPGDRFQPLGQKTPFKLKDFLINKKIASEERNRLALIFSDNILMCVADVAMSEAFKVEEKTKKIIKIYFQIKK
jgi:tRNA(Ile)-lysidine synthase